MPPRRSGLRQGRPHHDGQRREQHQHETVTQREERERVGIREADLGDREADRPQEQEDQRRGTQPQRIVGNPGTHRVK